MLLTAFNSRVRYRGAAAHAACVGSFVVAAALSLSHLGCAEQASLVGDASLVDATSEGGSSNEATPDARGGDAASPNDATARDTATMHDGASAPDSTPEAGDDAECTRDGSGAPGLCCNSPADCMPEVDLCCSSHVCIYCGLR
jgi:hypothetical protein